MHVTVSPGVPGPAEEGRGGAIAPEACGDRREVSRRRWRPPSRRRQAEGLRTGQGEAGGEEAGRGKCTWPLAGGGVCGSEVRLEVDHVVPRGKGGASTVELRRILCKGHNLEAAQAYGDEHMERFAPRNPVVGEHCAVYFVVAARPTHHPATISVPVTYDAASDASQAMASATSSAVPIRRMRDVGGHARRALRPVGPGTQHRSPHRRVDGARNHRVAADRVPGRGAVQGDRPGDAQHRRLAGGVGHRARHADGPGAGGDVDDAPAARPHGAQGMAATEHHALQVHGQYLPELREGEGLRILGLHRGAESGDAGAVHEDRERKGRERGEGALPGRLVADVERQPRAPRVPPPRPSRSPGRAAGRWPRSGTRPGPAAAPWPARCPTPHR